MYGGTMENILSRYSTPVTLAWHHCHITCYRSGASGADRGGDIREAIGEKRGAAVRRGQFLAVILAIRLSARAAARPWAWLPRRRGRAHGAARPHDVALQRHPRGPRGEPPVGPEAVGGLRRQRAEGTAALLGV